MLKRFMFASIGVLALALAFHLAADSTQAQASGTTVVAITGLGAWVWAVTPGGDTYRLPGQWSYHSNVFGGVAVQPSTWGQIKGRNLAR